MKKLFLMLFACVMSVASFAQDQTITFDKYTHNFGSFSEANSTQKCTFTFTNTGSTPLVITQAVASCGCTEPTYTKTPVQPGEKGTIEVKYVGAGKLPGHFKKTITVRSNGKPELIRLYIEGDMTEEKK